MQALVCNSLAPTRFSSSAPGSDGKSLRYLILNVHATRCTQEKKLLSHTKQKTVGLIKKRKQVAATSYWLGKMLKW